MALQATKDLRDHEELIFEIKCRDTEWLTHLSKGRTWQSDFKPKSAGSFCLSESQRGCNVAGHMEKSFVPSEGADVWPQQIPTRRPHSMASETRDMEIGCSSRLKVIITELFVSSPYFRFCTWKVGWGLGYLACGSRSRE